ncbi:MAG: zinc ribbon domain-containing protein [Muribaculaceae bacterium]|nr:zinc ribbon domain-containing protein [Muribaculaceae bacterium]
MAKFCTNCGAPLQGNEKFCTGCGKKIHCDAPEGERNEPIPDVAPRPDDAGQSKGEKHGMVLLVCSVVVLGVILIAFLAQYGSRNGGRDYEWERADSSACVSAVVCEVEEAQLADYESPGHVPLGYDYEEADAAVEENRAVAYNVVLKGGMTDHNGFFPIKVSFKLNNNGDIEDCVYQNIQYGGKIKMKGEVSGGNLELRGKDGRNDFTISIPLTPAGLVEDMVYYGVSTDGPKQLDVELTLIEKIQI